MIKKAALISTVSFLIMFSFSSLAEESQTHNFTKGFNLSRDREVPWNDDHPYEPLDSSSASAACSSLQQQADNRSWFHGNIPGGYTLDITKDSCGFRSTTPNDGSVSYVVLEMLATATLRDTSSPGDGGSSPSDQQCLSRPSIDTVFSPIYEGQDGNIYSVSDGCLYSCGPGVAAFIYGNSGPSKASCIWDSVEAYNSTSSSIDENIPITQDDFEDGAYQSRFPTSPGGNEDGSDDDKNGGGDDDSDDNTDGDTDGDTGSDSGGDESSEPIDPPLFEIDESGIIEAVSSSGLSIHNAINAMSTNVNSSIRNQTESINSFISSQTDSLNNSLSGQTNTLINSTDDQTHVLTDAIDSQTGTLTGSLDALGTSIVDSINSLDLGSGESSDKGESEDGLLTGISDLLNSMIDDLASRFTEDLDNSDELFDPSGMDDTLNGLADQEQEHSDEINNLMDNIGNGSNSSIAEKVTSLFPSFPSGGCVPLQFGPMEISCQSFNTIKLWLAWIIYFWTAVSIIDIFFRSSQRTA